MTKPLTSASYDETYFEKLYEVEDRHFWFRTRQAIVTALCKDLTTHMPSGYRVMEIGCGTGHLLRTLEETSQNGQVFGLDLFWEGLAFARQRTGAILIQGRAEQMPFPEEQFDLIGLFDVLEHLENDEEILQSVFQILKKGGKLMLTVPAERQLWSTTDLIARHQRRYETKEISHKLEKAGFHIEYISECMQALYPLARLRPKAPVLLEEMTEEENRKSHQKLSHELAILPVLNEIAWWVLSNEVQQIQNYKQIKRGTSIIAVARRIS